MKQMAIFMFLLGLVMLNSCSDGIVSECSNCLDDDVVIRSTFSSIQKEVFDKNCTTAGCHGSDFPAAGLVLMSGVSYNNIVNKKSTGAQDYIEPGNSAESYLFFKISSNTPGVTMPPAPNVRLPQYIIDTIKVWIDAGALNN